MDIFLDQGLSAYERRWGTCFMIMLWKYKPEDSERGAEKGRSYIVYIK